MCIETAWPLEKIRMTTLLHDSTVQYAKDPVATPHSRQSMSYDDRGSAADDLSHVLLNNSLTFVIKRARRLIKN